MKSGAIVVIAVAGSLLSTSPASAQESATVDRPTATLVYHFTYSAQQAIAARDSANPTSAFGAPGGVGGSPASGFVNPEIPPQKPTSGIAHYGGSLTDTGTMTVDIFGTRPDGGLVVRISEQGRDVRRAPPATCEVYGNTNVLCDPSKTVYTEEYTLLRFLGANFVDPNQIGLNKTWTIGPSTSQGQTVQASYEISNSNNGTLQIGETRKIVLSGSGKLETDIQTKIGYDFKRTLPTQVNEYATQRTDAGIDGTSTTTYQTTLSLLSDSIAAQP